MKRITLFLLVFFVFQLMVFAQSQNQRQYGEGLIASQLVIGGGYTTEIIATSVSPVVTQAQVDFGSQYDPNGIQMYVEVTDPVAGYNHKLVQGFNIVELAGGGMRRVTLTSPSQTPVVGFLLLKSLKTPEGGDSVIFSVRYKSPYGQAAVVPVRPGLTLAFPAIRSGGDQTGVAIAHINPTTAILSCKVRDTRGVEVLSAPIEIPAWGQKAKFLEYFFDLPMSWTEGRVECASNVPVAATTLEFSLDENGKYTFLTGTTFPLPLLLQD